MQVNVRLSAGLAQITQAARLQVTVPENASVADVASQLVAQYPGLQLRLGHAVAMLGGTHVPRTTPLVPDQEVAFLLPVAGGSHPHAGPCPPNHRSTEGDVCDDSTTTR